MRISDWSSDVCSSDLPDVLELAGHGVGQALRDGTPLAAVATQWLADPALRAGTEALAQSLWALLWSPLLVFAVLGAIWHALFEASPRQATPGQDTQRLVTGQGV